MKRVVAFLLFFSTVLVGLAVVDAERAFWTSREWWAADVRIAFHCALAGGFGGVTYCLRGVYLNASVRKEWAEEWLPWYVIRPFVSTIVGVVAFIFLRAGLFVLESTSQQDATNVGFLALAFIGGYNVDKFLSKLEDVAQATWGIGKSRSYKPDEKDQSESDSRSSSV